MASRRSGYISSFFKRKEAVISTFQSGKNRESVNLNTALPDNSTFGHGNKATIEIKRDEEGKIPTNPIEIIDVDSCPEPENTNNAHLTEKKERDHSCSNKCSSSKLNVDFSGSGEIIVINDSDNDDNDSKGLITNQIQNKDLIQRKIVKHEIEEEYLIGKSQTGTKRKSSVKNESPQKKCCEQRYDISFNSNEPPKLPNPFAKFAFEASPTFEPTKQSLHDGTKTYMNRPNHMMKSIPSSGSKRPTQKIPQSTKIKDLPLSERRKIRIKWQSFSDANASLENRRFQVFIAARLHARAQEPVIRSAMRNLFQYFQSSGASSSPQSHHQNGENNNKSICGTIDVHKIAKLDPNTLSQIVSSVHFANSKAKQIIESSKIILESRKFNGEVPECENDLKELKGIGPKLADILSYVNNRKAYTCSKYDEEIMGTLINKQLS